MKEICKYLLGYLAGFTFFMVLIPFGFYELSQLDASSHGKVFFGSGTLRFILFGVIFLIGAIFAIWSNIFLYTVGKGAPTEAFGVAVSPPTKKLVTDGPYRYTRNPMVFGAFSIYLSLVVLFNSITGSIVFVVFFLLVVMFLKQSEEKRLIWDFGKEYLEYREKAPMIFPRF